MTSTALIEADLREAADGSWQVILARPGRLTESALSAITFAHWPLLWPEAEDSVRRRGPMPPAPSQLAGEVLESHWDPARRAVVGTISVVEKLADLLRRVPRALRLRLDLSSPAVLETPGEHGAFTVTTVGRAPSHAGRLLEAAATAAATETRGGPVQGLTLQEAPCLPEVQAAIRATTASTVMCTGPESPEQEFKRKLRTGELSAVVPEPDERDGPTRRLRLIESLATPTPTPTAFAERCRRRGLDPARFGMPGGEAA